MTSRVEGVVLTELRQIGDQRGSVLHMMRCDSPEFVSFGECYFSEVFPGAIKAWKRHRAQTQNFAVPVGRIRLVIYDDRDGSTTRGNVLAVEIGRPKDYLRIKIPSGLWYGFACIGATPALLANCTDIPHDPSDGEVRSADHREIPYKWDARPGSTGDS